MNIDFNEKELSVIELLVPGQSAEETGNAVLRDWFNSLIERANVVKPQDQVLDDIIAAKAVDSVSGANGKIN